MEFGIVSGWDRQCTLHVLSGLVHLYQLKNIRAWQTTEKKSANLAPTPSPNCWPPSSSLLNCLGIRHDLHQYITITILLQVFVWRLSHRSRRHTCVCRYWRWGHCWGILRADGRMHLKPDLAKDWKVIFAQLSRFSCSWVLLCLRSAVRQLTIALISTLFLLVDSLTLGTDSFCLRGLYGGLSVRSLRS
jgi:hypothetical protein